MKLLKFLLLLVMLPIKLVSFTIHYTLGFIIHRIKLAFVNRNSSFPKSIKGLWYCGMWFKDRNKFLFQEENTVSFNPHTTGMLGRDTSGLINGLVPAVRIGNDIGLYRVTRYSGAAHCHGNLPAWDNGEVVDLEFVKSMDILQAEQVIFKQQPEYVEEMTDPQDLSVVIRKIQEANPETAQLLTPEVIKIELHRHIEHIAKVSARDASKFCGIVFVHVVRS